MNPQTKSTLGPTPRNRQGFEPSRSSEEVAKMFGFAKIKDVANAVRDGRFPSACFVLRSASGVKRSFWRLSVLNKFKKQMGVTPDELKVLA